MLKIITNAMRTVKDITSKYLSNKLHLSRAYGWEYIRY